MLQKILLKIKKNLALGPSPCYLFPVMNTAFHLQLKKAAVRQSINTARLFGRKKTDMDKLRLALKAYNQLKIAALEKTTNAN